MLALACRIFGPNRPFFQYSPSFYKIMYAAPYARADSVTDTYCFHDILHPF